MKLDNIFSFPRVWNLLKKDFKSNLNKTLIVSGAVAAVIILIAVINAYNGTLSDFLYFTLFANLLFIGGFIVTSGAFKEMHRKETVQNFLLLPASNFEKFFSRLLLTTIGYVLFAVISITLVSCFAEWINTLIFKRHNSYFNPLEIRVWQFAAHYIVLQSIFFLGAAYFRKYNLMKTINVIFLFLILVSILGAIFTRIVYFNLFEGIFSLKDSNPYIHVQWDMLPTAMGNTTHYINIVRIIYWLIPAPLFWTITFFRIKEAEVKNAV